MSSNTSPDRRRVALITGCSSPQGIGAQTALVLAERGYRVFVTARKVETMKQLEGKCELLQLDVNDEQSRRDVVREISERTGGKLDLLINNAGIYGHTPALEMSLDSFRYQLETNLVAPLAMIQSLAPLLVKGGNQPDESGKIRKSVVVNLGSLGKWGQAWMSGYNASKAALAVLTDSMRVEMEHLNIKVINCETGGVRTEAISHSIQARSEALISGYYPNWDAIYAKVIEQWGKDTQGFISAADFARSLVAKIDKREPNGKIWLGSMSNVLSWVMPLFDKFGLKDKVWKSLGFVGKLEKYKIKSID